jgi:hypothetical protein
MCAISGILNFDRHQPADSAAICQVAAGHRQFIARSAHGKQVVS